MQSLLDVTKTSRPMVVKAWVQDEVDLQQVIEAAVTAAKRTGANGLVNVNWHSDVDSIRPPGVSTWSSVDRGTIQLEGWAIKRTLE